MLEILKIPRDEQLENTTEVMSLMDLFPDFSSLCSVMSRCGVLVSDGTLLDLLGKFLIQSALEQYTLFGEEATVATKNAHTTATDLDDVHHINSKIKTQWADVRNDFLNILKPLNGDSPEVHLNRLAQQFPAFDFESTIIMQLQGFLFDLETPVLVKLETGELTRDVF